MPPRPAGDDLLDPDLLAVLLELRLITLSEVRSAADHLIAEAAEPPELAIELSLATDLVQVMDLVRPYPAVPPPREALAEGLKCLREAVEAGAIELADATDRFCGFAARHFGCYDDVFRAGAAWRGNERDGRLRTGGGGVIAGGDGVANGGGAAAELRQALARDLSRLHAGLLKSR